MTDVLLEVLILLREHEEVLQKGNNTADERSLIRIGLAARIIARVSHYEQQRNSSLAALQEPRGRSFGFVRHED